MKRKALIIANPGEKGEPTYCEGVNKDISLYRSFLRSEVGGLWHESEIRILERPRIEVVRSETRSLQNVDYSFITYCGHGYHSGRSTILALKEDVYLDSTELREGAPKQTLILDCCRLIERPTFLVEEMLKALKSRPLLHGEDCRKYFDKKIESCPKGLVVLYACSVDETAGDDATAGGYYSGSLLQSAQEWVGRQSANDTSKGLWTLSVVDAHEAAAKKVDRLSGGRQTPTLEKPRSDPYFPFAIVT